jgi:phosphoribosylglycinamide formyltransferase-1
MQPSMSAMPNIAIFASGNGSNFQALLDRKSEGLLQVTFALMIGNNSKSAAFDRARQYNIPAIHLAPSHFPSEQRYSEQLLETLTTHQINLIVLAGYMKKIPPVVVKAFHNRIVNIHPGLLPAFGGQGMHGIHVHQAVLDYGAKVSGITIHFIDEEYDHGPVILQETIPVLDDDDASSLAARVLSLEHAHYWRVIEAIAQGRLTLDGRKVSGRI